MIKNHLLTPFQQFVKMESFSGILLFSATLLAMAWANSPYAESYQALWQTKVGFGTEDFGISLFSFIAVKLGLAELPDQVNAWQILGVSILAGVGFTMSIFIANLAFTDSLVLVDSAKIGILVGSLVSGMVGAVILKISGNKSAGLRAAG